MDIIGLGPAGEKLADRLPVLFLCVLALAVFCLVAFVVLDRSKRKWYELTGGSATGPDVWCGCSGLRMRMVHRLGGCPDPRRALATGPRPVRGPQAS
jgi:hypothetical protein